MTSKPSIDALHTPTDAVDADPVKGYYAEKKRRYLQGDRTPNKDETPAMATGTPHDWDDAAGYAAPHDAGSKSSDD